MINNIDLVWYNSEVKDHLYDAVTNENILPWFSRACYEIGQHRDKKCFLEKRSFLFGSFYYLGGQKIDTLLLTYGQAILCGLSKI